MEVKNYNQPVDASLFPEGCPRCSLLKFLLHLVPVAAVGLWGAYAAFRVLAHGLGETGLDDYFGFGSPSTSPSSPSARARSSPARCATC